MNDELAKSLLTDSFEMEMAGDKTVQLSKISNDKFKDYFLLRKIYRFSRNDYTRNRISFFNTAKGDKAILTVRSSYTENINRCIKEMLYISEEISGKEIELVDKRRY